MATDAMKDAVCDVITQFVNGPELNRMLVYDAGDTADIGTVEVHDVAPSENVIRISSKRRSGAPRYFKVKVSEVL